MSKITIDLTPSQLKTLLNVLADDEGGLRYASNEALCDGDKIKAIRLSKAANEVKAIRSIIKSA